MSFKSKIVASKRLDFWYSANARVILGGFCVAIVVAPAVAGVLMWRVEQKMKAAKEAEPTYREVEPPTIPKGYSYIDRDDLDARCRADLEALFQKLFKQPSADDLDPQTGDLVAAYVSQDSDEVEPKRQTARVLWPRKTYVRARVYGLASRPDGTRPRVIVDIPRRTIAGVMHMTALTPS